MKPNLFFAALLTVLLAAGFRYAIKNHQNKPQQLKLTREAVYKNRQLVQCSPDWGQLDADSLAINFGVLPGWGNYRWKISTRNDSAQFYFNQGINMYYAFHIIEAMASFKKAEQFDNNNAMIYWAQALAYGPNINDFEYAATPDAFAAAQKALSLKNNCTAKEKALIDAMAVRYSADSSISRATLNGRYADAMKKASNSIKADADVATLYADALMLQHPWDYWKHDGKAAPWTPELLKVLEKVLAGNPNHPGANHYYIHSVEASGNPQRALQSANRLGKLMPQVSHMIHMPSHIYIRSGNYNEGIKVNEMSVKGYNNYLTMYPDVQNNAPLYLIHNLHMQTACAMMKSNYSFSNKSAVDCCNSFDTSFMSFPAPLGCFIQYVFMTPVISDVRFGKWDAILNAAPVAENYVYAAALYHWARGMAFAGKNNMAKATVELNMLQEKMKLPDMQVVMKPFNAPADAAKVAEKILEGTIAIHANNYARAITLFTEAAAFEDAMIYNEPKDWLLPARHYLGNALLKIGDAAKAEIIFKEDLKENPNNHWALYGLYQSLMKQKKNAGATVIKKQFDKAFEGNDIAAGNVVY